MLCVIDVCVICVAVPDLFLKVMKAINERLFDDYVLNKHVDLLVEEWNK